MTDEILEKKLEAIVKGDIIEQGVIEFRLPVRTVLRKAEAPIPKIAGEGKRRKLIAGKIVSPAAKMKNGWIKANPSKLLTPRRQDTKKLCKKKVYRV